MDDEDIEWELNKMDEAGRRREAQPQPGRTVYRPVDPGLAARLFRQMGRPYDKSAIPRGQEFYLNGWDNGGDDGEEEPPDFTPRQDGPIRTAFQYDDPLAKAWRPDWGPGGNPLRTMEERIGGGNMEKPVLFANSVENGQAEGGKDAGLTWSVDPLGMFPQYDVGKSSTGVSTGSGTLDRYRENEIVPKPVDEESGNTTFGEKVISIGHKQLGLPYVLGGDGVSATDCGKFTHDTYKEGGINLGTRMADEQHEFCKTNGSVFKDVSQARPGDMVFFQNTYGSWEPGTITHVGIYAGNGQMLHAGSSSGVSYADLNNDFWKSHFAGFGRPRR
jgi:hypothetical protein